MQLVQKYVLFSFIYNHQIEKFFSLQIIKNFYYKIKKVIDELHNSPAPTIHNIVDISAKYFYFEYIHFSFSSSQVI